MKKRVVIIGAGVGGLATACILGHAGYEVTVYEKNAKPGGRAGSFKAKGFTFDTGPSWYLMPDIFEQFFSMIDEDVNKLLKLKRLKPSYRVFFKDTLLGAIDIHGDVERDAQTLESIEPNARVKLREYLEKSTYQYNLATEKFLYKNYDSMRDFFTPQMLLQGARMHVFSSMQKYVARYFTTDEVQKIMQYPLVFLGASPQNAPALYSLMSHVDFNQGVFYPDGGMYKLTECLVTLAKARGVKFKYKSPVSRIRSKDGKAIGLTLADGTKVDADIVISNADIAHTELSLLKPSQRTYPTAYWKKRVLAPSALLLYLGVKKQYSQLRHHNLVFSKDWEANFNAIFHTKKWPADPSFYVCNPNKTDKTTAPNGKENLFVLVPVPATLKYSDEDQARYVDWILETMEQTMHLTDLRKNIIYKKVYAAKEFSDDFNSAAGTALGLAHTLKQTAIFRPSNKSRKVSGLYYVGANTSPGIGLPMCLISAQLVYKRLIDDTSNTPIVRIERT